jgi:hypothetical protein
MNLLNLFPAYIPYSGGSDVDRTAITIKTINEIFPSLKNLFLTLNNESVDIKYMVNLPNNTYTTELKNLFNAYGSDKASTHNYYLVYGNILSKFIGKEISLLEIGLGTNNTDVVSNMGIWGKPGASLRAFRDFLVNANIYGADIDERVLFNERQIQTFYTDQTNPQMLDSLGKKVSGGFDIIIDDGLHSPDANINTLTFALKHIKKGGHIIIEDIHEESLEIWNVVSIIMKLHNYDVTLYHSKESAYMFIVNT